MVLNQGLPQRVLAKRPFDPVDGDPLEILNIQRKQVSGEFPLPGQCSFRHQGVVDIQSYPIPLPKIARKRMRFQVRDGSGMQIGREAHFERNPVIKDVLTQRSPVVAGNRVILHQASRMTDAMGSAMLNSLPNG